MGQRATGTASVTNASATVDSSIGNDWSTVIAGNLFGVADVWYIVAGNATLFSGTGATAVWRINLTAVYAGVTNTAAIYAIAQDFDPTYGFPILNPGDTQIATLLNRIHLQLAGVIGTPVGGGSGTGSFRLHSKVITGTDIGALTITMAFSPALTVVPSFVGTPGFTKASAADDNVFAVSIDSITTTGYNVNLSAPAVSGETLRNIYAL